MFTRVRVDSVVLRMWSLKHGQPNIFCLYPDSLPAAPTDPESDVRLALAAPVPVLSRASARLILSYDRFSDV